ncbi:plasmid maintenance system antidote protein, XRE family [Modicisalibacter muralis]|uniref:Plasmid maintenance system antidote protein, XRE family n=1 Tax=Modicisalibacter muralis TaxID=119000 RepID=A0A1G9RL49_9GAMM|nr:HigA family addiction module antitoxin [Halomonas muralis]SDM24022.1 plasmid maintenance system antidote protein, XRE family [Halomonas muralis]
MSHQTRTVDLLPNIHPGEILLEDYIEPMGLTKNALATAINVPATRIGEITRGTRAITADTDLRLSRYFGTSEGYWLRLQIAYDLTEARRSGHYDNIRPRTA